MKVLNKKDIVYYARIVPSSGIYDLYELSIRTVEDTYFVGVDKKDKRAFLFDYDAIGEYIFANRKDALNRLKDAEKNKKEISNETYYEEY